MIINLTNAFQILREKYIVLKRRHLEYILQFVYISSPTNSCLICTCDLEKSDSNVATNLLNDLFEALINQFNCTDKVKLESIENKICRFCMSKINTNLPKFCLKPGLSISNTKLFNEMNLSNINWIYLTNRRSDIIIKQKVEFKMQEIENKMTEIQNDCTKDICISYMPIIEQYKNYLKRSKLKDIITAQIKYKIETIEEQLENIKINYQSALLEEDLDEANSFQEMFYNLYELKLKMEEKHYKHKNEMIPYERIYPKIYDKQ